MLVVCIEIICSYLVVVLLLVCLFVCYYNFYFILLCLEAAVALVHMKHMNKIVLTLRVVRGGPELFVDGSITST